MLGRPDHQTPALPVLSLPCVTLLATVYLHLSVHLFYDMHSAFCAEHSPILCTHIHIFLAQQLQPQCLCCFCSVSAFEAESKVAYAKLENFLAEAAILQVCTSLLCQPFLARSALSADACVITITSLQDITINRHYTCTTTLMHLAGAVLLSCSQLTPEKAIVCIYAAC